MKSGAIKRHALYVRLIVLNMTTTVRGHDAILLKTGASRRFRFRLKKDTLRHGMIDIGIDGAITNIETNAAYSSRGPVDDGRLKPEIVASGNTRFSTVPDHVYVSNAGTSFSSPAFAGIAALLYERYRQLHNDSLPEAALIKNVLCNSADNLGPAGPDYTFGRVNGGAVHTTSAGALAAGMEAVVPLEQPYDFSATGAYELWAWTSSPMIFSRSMIR